MRIEAQFSRWRLSYDTCIGQKNMIKKKYVKYNIYTCLAWSSTASILSFVLKVLHIHLIPKTPRINHIMVDILGGRCQAGQRAQAL